MKQIGFERLDQKIYLKRGSTLFGIRRITAILIVFLSTIQLVSAQKTDTSARFPQALYNFYMEKHKINKTAGWLLLIPGATLITKKGVVNVSNSNKKIPNGFNQQKKSGLGFIGEVMSLTNMPFFLLEGNNRKKAYLSFKREKVVTGDSGRNNFSYLAIDLKIKF